MDITGTTRVFFILGDPVAQVRAPEVFNPLFRRHGVDAVLVPARVSPANVAGFVRHAFMADNIDGLWLTIPHKSLMLPLLDHCDVLGRAAGAVNAVRRLADGSIEGALFDGIGLAKALDRFGLATRGARVLIIGAGGAGLAIAASLAQRECAELALLDTTPGRAAKAAARMVAHFGSHVTAPADADPAGYDIVINATPLGLRSGDPLPLDVQRLSSGAAVVDILMKNQPTPLLQACARRGITAHPGYEMMLQQMPEYLGFFGLHDLAKTIEADRTEMRALLEDR